MRRLVVFLTIFLLAGLAVMVASGFNPLELKLKAGLQVTTSDVTSSVFVDDQFLDRTPFINKEIQPGNYVLRIEPDAAGYASYELPVTLNKGVVTVVNWDPGPTLETSGGVIYEMEKLPRSNDVQIDFQTVPDGVILTFDSNAKQFSPLLLTGLEEGAHQFEVSLPSYKTQQHSINLIKGHKVTVTAIMAKTGEIPLIEETPGKTAPETEAATAPATIPTGPQVQILSTNFFVNDEEVLRVRNEPNAGGAELGFAPVGEYYPYLDEDTGWFQIDFNGQPGWVSAEYSQTVNVESVQTGQ